MARITRRRLRCFYCGEYTRNEKSGFPQSWFCKQCEAVNYLDEKGDIADPPTETTTNAPPASYGHARPASPSIMPAESPFCDTCQRHQILINKALADYIPDESDPSYEQHVATADSYRAELETRYPQVCDNCIGRVHDQMRAAGYAAKADHFRRILETSKKSKLEYSTPRQIWTLRAISLAKWVYVGSIVTGIFWHLLQYFAIPGVQEEISWHECLLQFRSNMRYDRECLRSATISRLTIWAVVGDVLTIWWNPKLAEKTNRSGGRMRGLVLLWLVRSIIIALRTASLFQVDEHMKNATNHHLFTYGHLGIVVVLLLSVLVSWKAVWIEYQSTRSFMQDITPHLPSAQAALSHKNSPIGTTSVRPNATTYDTMAHSFATSLVGPEDDQQIDYPPSPTMTEASISTRATEQSTPWPRRRPSTHLDAVEDEDAMDWTPTTRRFGREQDIEPIAWSHATSSSVQPRQEPQPHSIFAQRDPNPFSQRVPSFPKNPTREKLDPWKPGVWAPALPENKRNFFQDMMKKGESPESQRKIVEGVPKVVKRDEELFQKPQLKYDYQGYAGYKTTGLEDTFNGLFSK
ncbi:hypothetical protein BU24DRAFT_166597 [Aaosphaeria arxii CBS 175.79]|uniref:Ima1 N-terminal domain-containing protein n=1 Tax=Aaosphaeria arxii CBS 175.79 TaxID=1450172 RepID=A0A6A5Y016_9PLEO|nr:uncharacterized protein BU24DRAFT_166597 [Aaosphaeria arxii CBS 175.79]KAF2018180.1 hypothetical protein BU24DRAFT_166597 [Aaosphaeria arxii CBS 175.79]